MRTLSWLCVSLSAGMPAITETAMVIFLYRDPKPVFYFVGRAASSSRRTAEARTGSHVAIRHIDAEGARNPIQLRANFLPFRDGPGIELQVVDESLNFLSVADRRLDRNIASFGLLEVAEHRVGLLFKSGHQPLDVLFLAGAADGALLESDVQVFAERLRIFLQVL